MVLTLSFGKLGPVAQMGCGMSVVAAARVTVLVPPAPKLATRVFQVLFALNPIHVCRVFNRQHLVSQYVYQLDHHRRGQLPETGNMIAYGAGSLTRQSGKNQ
jgi:hypothetical protein